MTRPVPPPLPIDAYLDEIVRLVGAHRAAIVSAAPGAGKTTRVPPALSADGPVLLLQPRRVAARAIARRIAEQQGWTTGREVGWHVRFDRRSSPDTRVLVATEGILTARLQHDPLLDGVRTLVIDEFHERSIHADLGLALARQAWLARDDLRIVVMSATIDTAPIAAFLGGCPVVEVPGRLFPLDILYRPHVAVEQAAIDLLSQPVSHGAMLCFLPGSPEIRRTAEALAGRPPARGIDVLPLHGSLDADAQDAALRPSSGRRIILATNIAETTVTVPDVTAVVDTGLQKIARYDAGRLVDSLELERVSQDSADQRAGRAGRTQPGVVVRLWDSRDRLRSHREPEIARVDLAGPALDVLAWGGDPRTLDWFEAPPPGALDAAMRLLERLGVVNDAEAGRLTVLGRQMQRLPLHPRLARLLLAARGSREAARACALLSERHFVPPRHLATSCDLLSAVDDERSLPGHVRFAAGDIERLAASVLKQEGAAAGDDESFRRAVLAAYPDRVARRRAPKRDRLLLASGTGARLGRESGVHDAEFLVAVDVAAGASGGEAIVRLATGIEAAWLSPTSRERTHRIDEAGTVRASEIDKYDQLVLAERSCRPDAGEASSLIAAECLRRGPDGADAELMRRLAFIESALTFESLVRAAAEGATRLDDVDLAAHLPRDVRDALARGAPETLPLPSRRRVRIQYRDNGVFVAVKLQELFGMRDSPRIGRRQVPITFELLAPNGRPVQVTSDLASFWTRGYPEVRKELRARYPKHEWPEEP